MSVLAKSKKTRHLIRGHFPDTNPLRRLYLFLDVVWAALLYGGTINDYFCYKFHLRKHADRKNFVFWRKRRRIINTCNNKPERDIFNFKPRFCAIFNHFLGRDWLDISVASMEDFEAFIAHHQQFFVKTIKGSFGVGVRLEEVGTDTDLKSLYQSLQKEKVLLEEIIQQDEELAAFNSTTVNTLRLITLLYPDGQVKVMTANIRLGRHGRCADNFHHQGIAASIDVATGIVVNPGMDMELRQYVHHPDTGKQIVGFQIPHWHKIIDTVKAAAQVVPSIRYVGWDVAVGKGGKIIIVEGNCASGQDVCQMPDQTGKWPLYKQELKHMPKI